MKKRAEVIQHMDVHTVALRDEMHRDLADEDAFEALEQMERKLRDLRRGKVTITELYAGSEIVERIETTEPDPLGDAGDLSDLTKKVGELNA